MVGLHRKPFKRQEPNPFATPTLSGIGGSVVAETSDVPDGGLAVNSELADAPRTGSPNFTVSTSNLPSTPTSSSPALPSSTEAPTTESAVASKSSGISTTTVVGACVGAFAGAVFLICIGLWLYRRSTQALKARARAPLTSISRNARHDRSDSHRGDPWNKLESGDEDKWAGMQTSEVGHRNVEEKGTQESVGPMEKLTMFKTRSPSVRTAVTTKSNLDLPLPIFDRMHAHPFNPYGGPPSLPGSVGSKPHLGSVDTGGSISWSSEQDGAYFSLRSDNFDINTARAISPSAARPTPPTTTTSSLHQWESAEVVTYSDPFDDEQSESRKSIHNPFFSAQEFDEAKSKAVAKAAKGKEKVAARDDHSSDSASTTSSPLAPKHAANDSQSDNERAILSIIAALENGSPSLTPEPNSRVLSTLSTGTGYSGIDGYSVSAYGQTEEDVTQAFPLPPHAKGSN
ncbi:hypothetical protein PC9H_009962 [Pleurotus ostreatus]|uniref:Uncharacterized protein n=1 Tax=Pleurotus ostreatus TaxID=5322 RepID=A0A8H6ZQ16_PLEOS|nr:uncharacterized protein PC9H_009962 [Pleurotus ostreatus]KAF7424652.1 hypothetical protein PC9H_009962 [Pleurotus ostreatus]KAJ8692370.1 hypothetical protein PTI98_009688 [Pleurotus ostreatus]